MNESSFKLEFDSKDDLMDGDGGDDENETEKFKIVDLTMDEHFKVKKELNISNKFNGSSSYNSSVIEYLENETNLQTLKVLIFTIGPINYFEGEASKGSEVCLKFLSEIILLLLGISSRDEINLILVCRFPLKKLKVNEFGDLVRLKIWNFLKLLQNQTVLERSSNQINEEKFNLFKILFDKDGELIDLENCDFNNESLKDKFDQFFLNNFHPIEDNPNIKRDLKKMIKNF